MVQQAGAGNRQRLTAQDAHTLMGQHDRRNQSLEMLSGLFSKDPRAYSTPLPPEAWRPGVDDSPSRRNDGQVLWQKEQSLWRLFGDCFTAGNKGSGYLLPRMFTSAISSRQAPPSWEVVKSLSKRSPRCTASLH